ncbi:radical S-adenosyl methionine domain-containing protein 1, mitochondrial isoform X2 [Melanerpes formicivorus]|uniref:radical S-adenosyl methionine domain-containing protein 1, mitochondrial isoform X2 n=1 Tax=Melanerpes formicivorus TaxID=211600 RepID=UPI00358EE3E7
MCFVSLRKVRVAGAHVQGCGCSEGGVPAIPHSALCPQWPYCRKRCFYCSFNKYVVPAVDEAAMGACLVREARTLLRLSQVQSVTSVFFGGGTPSLASPRTIAAVLEGVAGAVHLPAGTEITLEANPSSSDTQHLADFKAAGVNRLSIGVQSLNDAELRLLGREHTAAEARNTVEVARRLFPGRTSLDLIFGLPGQSQEAWTRGLEEALRLSDDHISLYQLTLERGTLLAAQVWGGALPTPAQDLLADMYQAARAVLVAAGFRHYEVSNFARKGEGSCCREARVQTLEPDAWMQEVQSRGHGTRRRVVLSPLEQLEEVLVLGLRTDEGITHARWQHVSPHLSLEAVFGAPGEAKALQQQGWLVLDSNGLRCTWEGLAVLDSLLPDLLCQLQRCWAPPATPVHHTAGTVAAGP